MKNVLFLETIGKGNGKSLYRMFFLSVTKNRSQSSNQTQPKFARLLNIGYKNVVGAIKFLNTGGGTRSMQVGITLR